MNKKIKILKKETSSLFSGKPQEGLPKSVIPQNNQNSVQVEWRAKAMRSIDLENDQEIDLDILNRMKIAELIGLARQLHMELNEEEVTKQRLIYHIIEKAIHKNDKVILGTGVFEKMNDNYGFLRSPEYNYLPGPEDIYVSPSQIRNFGLRTGDTVRGQIRLPKKHSEKYFALLKVNAINFTPVDKNGSRSRVSFDSLTPCYASNQFKIETTTENYSTRIIDLFSPIGKGQRALIVSPPKAGKTVLLQNIANSIRANYPETFIIVLLIDERPEEVTDMRRNVDAEVISSTFDEPATRHVSVAKIVIERAKRLAEQKMDVVILLDSLTRLARAYNQVEPASGKILSGGVDSNALHKPKRFFGAARNIEEGGSLSIIATALIDTGSKMDEVIFEEFKGTGNMELLLSRRIAERRIFPAVDVRKSGTRREELMLGSDVIQRLFALRNALGDLDEVENISLILKKMKMTKDNSAFFNAMNSSV